MGYILPIMQYEYINYQIPDIRNKFDHHSIEKPFKIKLDMQQPFNYDPNFTNKEMNESNFISPRLSRGISPVDEQVIANITGKGSLFNETI